jgi:cytochrome bd-type quinol oxidase subunit 2
MLALVAAPMALVHAAGGSSNPSSGGSSNPSSGGSSNSGKTRIENPIGSGDLQSFLNKLLEVFIMLGAIIVVFFIIYAGLQYVLARGDVKQIEQAHKTLLWTVVGAAILLGAQVISTVIQNTVKELAK